jgi:hypothetical protein
VSVNAPAQEVICSKVNWLPVPLNLEDEKIELDEEKEIKLDKELTDAASVACKS